MSTSQWDRLRHFKPAEFTHPDLISPYLLRVLDQAREKAGVPFHITSDVRPEDVGSAHASGFAVDIRAHASWLRLKIVQALLDVGINRIGVYNRHIHADIDPSRPSHVMWWGTSEPVHSQGELFDGETRKDESR
jgi:hypothetical protein